MRGRTLERKKKNPADRVSAGSQSLRIGRLITGKYLVVELLLHSDFTNKELMFGIVHYIVRTLVIPAVCT